MSFRSKIALITVLSLNFSVCTGGLLSVGTVFAGQLGSVNQESTFLVVMTPEDTTSVLCQSLTPEIEVTSEGLIEQPADEIASCESGDTCLQHARGDTIDRIVIQAPAEILEYATLSTLRIVERESSVSEHFLTRDGPLYEQPKLLAHTLLKRE